MSGNKRCWNHFYKKIDNRNIFHLKDNDLKRSQKLEKKWRIRKICWRHLMFGLEIDFCLFYNFQVTWRHVTFYSFLTPKISIRALKVRCHRLFCIAWQFCWRAYLGLVNPRYIEYYKVVHYLVFWNQNKQFVYWRAGLDRKQ